MQSVSYNVVTKLSNINFFCIPEVVICYYGTWASYRVGLGKFEVADIPTDLCTHIVYTFLGIDYSGNVKSLDPYLDYEENWGKGTIIFGKYYYYTVLIA